MKCEIRDGILVVFAESNIETELMKLWRSNWHKKPKAEKWFECVYYNGEGK